MHLLVVFYCVWKDVEHHELEAEGVLDHWAWERARDVLGLKGGLYFSWFYLDWEIVKKLLNGSNRAHSSWL
jgi:hypothetical protein